MEGWIEWYYENSRPESETEDEYSPVGCEEGEEDGKHWYGKEKCRSTKWSRAPVHQIDAIAAAL